MSSRSLRRVAADQKPKASGHRLPRRERGHHRIVRTPRCTEKPRSIAAAAPAHPSPIPLTRRPMRLGSWRPPVDQAASETGGAHGRPAQAQKSRTRDLTRAGTWKADATASPHRTSTRACDAPIRAAISSVRISAATGGFRQWFSCQKLTKPLRPALRRTDAEAGEQLKVQGGWSSGDSAARARRSAAVASGSAL